MNEMDIFFKPDSKSSSHEPETESVILSESSPEYMKEVYENYKFYMAEVQRLHEILNDKSDRDFPGSEKRIIKRFEKFDRLTTMANRGLECQELTDKEWTVLDLTMEGWSQRRIAPVVKHSDTHVGRILIAALSKICDFLNGK